MALRLQPSKSARVLSRSCSDRAARAAPRAPMMAASGSTAAKGRGTPPRAVEGGAARGGRSGARAAEDGCVWRGWGGAGAGGAGAAGIGVAARKRNWCPGATSPRPSQSMGASPSASSAPMSRYQPSRAARSAWWRASVMGAIYASRPAFAASPARAKVDLDAPGGSRPIEPATDGLGKCRWRSRMLRVRPGRRWSLMS